MLYRMYRYIQKNTHDGKILERNKTKAAFKYQNKDAELWFQDTFANGGAFDAHGLFFGLKRTGIVIHRHYRW